MTPGEASNRNTNAENRNDQERRRQERRQRQQNPQEERRQNQRRQEQQHWPGENMQSGTSQAQKADGHTPEQQSVPAERHEQKDDRERPSGNSEPPGASLRPVFHPFNHANDSSGLKNQTAANEAGRREFDQPPQFPPGREASADEQDEDFGESHDRPFGRGKAGGKIDSSQRDMGQTGQTMKSVGCGGPMSTQQGPYGPHDKHRGPIARGKPLMDDWGKSDKH